MPTSTQERSPLALIPANTLVKVRLVIRPGGVDPDGWLTQSKTSSALYIDTESIVLGGPFAGRRIYSRIGYRGKVAEVTNADMYATRGRELIRSIVSSARGVRPDDRSGFGAAAHTGLDLAELNGLEFVACIGVETNGRRPADRGRNVIQSAVGPDHPQYHEIMDPVSSSASRSE